MSRKRCNHEGCRGLTHCLYSRHNSGGYWVAPLQPEQFTGLSTAVGEGAPGDAAGGDAGGAV